MTILHALVLGIIQGLTEFLPISSSAHLVIVPFIFNWEFPAEQVFPFDVLVQMGTLVGVIVYFFKDLVKLVVGFFSAVRSKDWQDEQFRLGINLVIATIPAGIIGLLFNDLIEEVFHHPGVTGIFLLFTALFLFLGERLGKRTKSMLELKWLDALIFGIGQALAVFPGISRSGATMSAGMLRKTKRDDAARFSFLMSIPVMLMAGVFSAVDIGSLPDLNTFLPVLLVGFLTSLVVGYVSISWLLRFLRTKSLYPFVIYCAVLGIVTIICFYA